VRLSGMVIFLQGDVSEVQCP